MFADKLVKNIKIPKLFCRASTVPKIFLKKFIPLYKGNLFTNFFFTKYSIAYKLGEFAFTRKPFYYPAKKKKR
jgi:ribosomal protein S19